MLIIPISGKIGWRNPPLITLVILLINCLVYFLFQTHDDAARMAAEDFYLDSGLMAIEVPYYRDYLETTGKAGDEDLTADPADTEAMMRLHFALETDADFLRRLKNDQVITPQSAEYENWRGLRQEYERKCNRSVAYAHGLRPAASRISAFFTYMFLHGSVGHLVGNMVFLWILGCMIEIGAGRLLFTGIYLLSGLMAGGLFCLVYPSSMVPLVGASGAIAGLMGAYTVLYGRTRVSVFYSLGFYFNTARIPAIVLLPAWIANECYQLFFSGASHVAYVAHIGGLAGGALLAYAGDRLVGKVDRDSFAETAEDKIAPLMHQALEHVAKLEMRPAQALFEEVLALSPDHPEALSHLFNIHKLSPDSPAFHDVAKRLLQLYGKTPATHPAAITLYATYTGLTKRPALSIPLYLQMAGIMAAAGETESAEKIVLAILRQRPQTPGLPASLIKLAKAFHQAGHLENWKRYRNLIRQRYPDSVEAGIISRMNAPAENRS